ncbi:MAG TPA: M13 family metallopeptidase [Polyangia bacterium]|nr:M13 family metallopeptidase [Polyangia bacterium]
MQKQLIPMFALLVLTTCQSAPEPAPEKAVSAAPAAAAAPVATSEPPGMVDEGALDRTINPCDDFYGFACGSWMKKTPIPPDRASWVRSFSEIQERNEARLHKILEDDAAGKPGPDDPYAKKLGDFYASCMDEAGAESAGMATFKEELAKLDQMKDGKALARQVAWLHLSDVDALFGFTARQDLKDATQVIGMADQGGLGLPDRDYYLKDDAQSSALRKQYVEHVAKMLELLAARPAAAATQARAIMQLETALAKASMALVDRRDPYKIYHRLERAGLSAKAPRFAWDAYFEALGPAGVQAINVTNPDFFGALNELLAKTRPGDLKTYLRWQMVNAAAPALGKQFVDEDFHFRAAALTGEKEILPRWKRCVETIDGQMGEALARPFVAQTFGADGKARSQAIITTIERAFENNLGTLGWMDAATRAQAIDKLHRIVNKIGYPDPWRNYDALEIDRTSYLKNRIRAAVFESKRVLAKIGKPVDRGEWGMSPPTVNAYYNALLNEMVFPAGILQPPFFNRAAGLSTNYGGIGMVMGHELTHGFDDQGRKFDAAGNLRDWWSPEVNKVFTEHADCVAQQYDGYVVIDGQHINGRLTLGENIADLGGLKMAWIAFHAAQAGKPPLPKVAGLDQDQQFFLGHAQAWCMNRRPEDFRRRLIIDTHSPAQFRVNGPVSDLPEFAAAFQCKPGSKMAPAKRCTVW